MKRRLIIVLVLASVIGLAASLLVYRVVVNVAQANQQQPTEQILVAAVNMDLAETITSKHVRLVPWPKPTVPPGAIRSLADAEGRVVRSSIVAGEPLLEGKLAPQLSGKGGIMPMLVPVGQRAITIKVDDAIKESGFVLPNSRVDVFVSMPRAANRQDRIAKLILQDVAVLAAGQAVEMRDNRPVSVTTVTLALTPDQAERLALAQNEGKLTIGMRNLRDEGVVQTTGATRETLIGTSAPPAKPLATRTRAKARPRLTPAPAVVSAPLPVPKIEVHTVAVIRSGKPSEQVFVRKGETWVEKDEQKR
ncbi:MAG TPA: Flp pilus assembly protein CpaB [Methylomirabilota bacterium]|nr:Flp pilus assembly protein CpaB [Methylomirabilota bacterium]